MFESAFESISHAILVMKADIQDPMLRNFAVLLNLDIEQLQNAELKIIEPGSGDRTVQKYSQPSDFPVEFKKRDIVNLVS